MTVDTTSQTTGAGVAAGKREALSRGLAADKAVVAVGAHDALSASLVERYGFHVVWASGLGVSTMAYALPDLNLITMTEALEAATRMDAASSLPVVADCDNGYGGLLNLVRTVRAYEDAGIAGICVEDNVFPKRNSLYRGETRRELIPVAEQARRLGAAKNAQRTQDFVLIARVEALIAGHGVEEALRRANDYAAAGVDAVLMHSRDRTLAEVHEFLGRWDGAVPLVAVPTLFPDFRVDQLHEMGFQMVIFANQTMRASVKAMEETLQRLQEGAAAAADPYIVDVDHVFELVRTSEAIRLEEGAE